ncbi:MAG: GNAT family N-acetyltransferase [Selenomonadaceae bacterium]|nr:GNAT family N-acetyltransferase [Selenomonadaceae bacterium]
MIIRIATLNDLEKISAVERECFPVNEAATREIFENRLKFYANHFWLLFDGDNLVSFVDGLVTDEPDLTDEMYERAEMHNENGKWQMIFGVNTIPAYRKKGLAGKLIQQAITDSKIQNRKGLVLTCKDSLVSYYSKFGFINEGKTLKSSHGGVEWNQMRLTF